MAGELHVVHRLLAQMAHLPLVFDHMDASGDEWLAPDSQDRLCTMLLDTEPTLSHPPLASYVTRFLTRYSAKVAERRGELCDRLATEVALRTACPPTADGGRGCASYWVYNAPTTVRVSRQRHTIGLALWEATFAMVQHLLRHPALIADQHVLELGSGTALGSLMLARHVRMASLTATDVGSDVLDNIAHNIGLNADHHKCPVHVHALDWFQAVPADLPPYTVVIGSDLVYDPVLLPGLVSTLAALLVPPAVAYLTCSVRAATTLAAFKAQAAAAGLCVEDTPLVTGTPSGWSADAPAAGAGAAAAVGRGVAGADVGGGDAPKPSTTAAAPSEVVVGADCAAHDAPWVIHTGCPSQHSRLLRCFSKAK